uniref:Uncharacterized protein n=1 Tax=Peronospora matthiolae TaxID=2874970 RepID=A0AAV1T272_9STRA
MLTFQSKKHRLLSSYYDDARVLTEQTPGFAQDKLSEHTDTLERVQSEFDNVKKATRDTTSKFYQDNVTPTLNPILDPIWPMCTRSRARKWKSSCRFCRK